MIENWDLIDNWGNYLTSLHLDCRKGNGHSIPVPEIQKIIGPNTTNNMASTTGKSGTDRWQYYHQQQQRQQLLQQVAASVSLPQPVPTVPPLRPGLYPPISMSQFYPNNYTIDPCNATALSYYSAICPYGSYPYYSRLHPGSLPGYHFPMQESLRPLQHMDKRFPSVQEHMLKYPAPPSTSNLQHTSNLDYDRLRGNSTGNNAGVTTCLPSLFLPPSSLSSSPQTLPRAPLTGYPTNGQFSRNRMIPDVVAAAAAAAVVAAASFDRQRGDALACNRADATGMINVIDRDAHVPDPSKTVINRNATNQAQNNNFTEESHEERARYQQVQNFLFDRLALVKTADNFVQASSVAGNDTHSVMTPTASTTPYRMSLTPTQHTSLSKNTSSDELRNCETPHLGKVNRSPNSLYNLACSNCGAVGPKFKCLGCEMVVYCDERCQEKHWNVHVQWCPKKMPKLKKVT